MNKASSTLRNLCNATPRFNPNIDVVPTKYFISINSSTLPGDEAGEGFSITLKALLVDGSTSWFDLCSVLNAEAPAKEK